MSFKVTGFDKLEKQLNKMSEATDDLSKMDSIPLLDLFTPLFMQQCSSFSSFEDFLSTGGYSSATQEEFEAIPEESFNKYISSSTSFDNWNEMLQEATNQYISHKLGF